MRGEKRLERKRDAPVFKANEDMECGHGMRTWMGWVTGAICCVSDAKGKSCHDQEPARLPSVNISILLTDPFSAEDKHHVNVTNGFDRDLEVACRSNINHAIGESMFQVQNKLCQDCIDDILGA